jgi:hypothetical protein
MSSNLENQKQNLRSLKQDIIPGKKKAPHEKRLTVMIIRSIGKVHSFKVSPPYVFAALAFFVIYVSVSIFLINRYFDLRHMSLIESAKVKELEKQISKSQNILYRSQQHVALLEGYIRDLQKEKPEDKTPPKNKVEKEESVASQSRRVSGATQGPEKTENLVDVEDMIIHKRDTRLLIDFKLVKTQEGEEVVGGYIHIIATGEPANPPLEWTLPRERLEDGVPINFRQGQRFSIQRFKPIHGEIHLAPDVEPPTAVKVLVYDRAGVLVLAREFEIGKGS